MRRIACSMGFALCFFQCTARHIDARPPEAATSPSRANAHSAPQLQIHAQLFEASGKTLADLGLERDGKPVADAALLKDDATWQAALETAYRLGAVKVLSEPVLGTVSGREATLEILGADFSSFAEEHPAGPNHRLNWSVLPVLKENGKVRLEVSFTRTQADVPHDIATATGREPGVRQQKVNTALDLELGKPTIVGSLLRGTAPANSDKKSAAVSHDVHMVVVVTPKLRPSTPPSIQQVRADLLFLDVSPTKLKSYLQSSQEPAETLLAFFQKRHQEHAATVAPANSRKILEELIRPLQDAKVVKVYSSPSLTSAIGHEAFVQVGGEFPFPVPKGDAITIEYKNYGIDFRFTPELADERSLRLIVKSRNTLLDEASAKTIGTFRVPGVRTVEKGSVHEVAFGQPLVFGPFTSPDGKNGVRETDETGIMIVAVAHPILPTSDESTPSLDNTAAPDRKSATRPQRRRR